MISVASKPKRSQHRTAHKRKHYAKTRAIYCVACSLCPEVEKQFLFYKSLTLHVSFSFTNPFSFSILSLFLNQNRNSIVLSELNRPSRH